MPTSRSPKTRAEGFSLLELMVVMAIMSALFGIGIGAFHKLNRAERVAERAVKDVLRSARLFARAESAPASMLVRPSTGEVVSMGLRTVGNWHFEDADGTGWPVPANHPFDALVRDGQIGSGLHLTANAELVIPSPPGAFDSLSGFGVDVAVRPEAEGRPMTILERAGVWAVDLDGDDALRVTLELSDAIGETRSVHELPVHLPSDRWSRLLVVFDGRTLHVSIDGSRVADDTVFGQTRKLARNPGVAITSGREVTRFRGYLDELRIGSVLVGQREELPPEVRLLGEERVIHLDAFGHLDPAWHRTPEQVSFLYGEPLRRTTVEVGLLGTVRSDDVLVPAQAALELRRVGGAASAAGTPREPTTGDGGNPDGRDRASDEGGR